VGGRRAAINAAELPLTDMRAIAQFFHFDERQTTLAREVRGGVTTFLTMVYIVFLNSSILANAGVPQAAAGRFVRHRGS